MEDDQTKKKNVTASVGRSILIAAGIAFCGACGAEADPALGDDLNTGTERVIHHTDITSKSVRENLAECANPKKCQKEECNFVSPRLASLHQKKIQLRMKRRQILDVSRTMNFGMLNKQEMKLVEVFWQLPESERERILGTVKGYQKRFLRRVGLRLPPLVFCGKQYSGGFEVAPLDKEKCALELGALARMMRGGSSTKLDKYGCDP